MKKNCASSWLFTKIIPRCCAVSGTQNVLFVYGLGSGIYSFVSLKIFNYFTETCSRQIQCYLTWCLYCYGYYKLYATLKSAFRNSGKSKDASIIERRRRDTNRSPSKEKSEAILFPCSVRSCTLRYSEQIYVLDLHIRRLSRVLTASWMQYSKQPVPTTSANYRLPPVTQTDIQTGRRKDRPAGPLANLPRWNLSRRAITLENTDAH
jgi:hypothetical protein